MPTTGHNLLPTNLELADHLEEVVVKTIPFDVRENEYRSVLRFHGELWTTPTEPLGPSAAGSRGIHALKMIGWGDSGTTV